MAFLGLGGNIGNRLDNLHLAIKKIETECGPVVKKSQVYETEAWGSSSTKLYLNQVIKLKTKLTARELITKLLQIEQKLGRKRTEQQFSNRKIDIDVLFFNNEISHFPNLKLPHPRLHLRKFVLVPLYEIEKNLIHPILKKNIKTLLDECGDELEVTPYPSLKKPFYICIEGNIGSGKSTLAGALSKQLSGYYLPEVFEDNQLLPLFYKNPRAFAFMLEYSFLFKRFEQINHAFEKEQRIIISDYSIYKSLWFAKINLSKQEFLLFKKHFKAIAGLLPEPELIIVLKTDTDNLLINIKKRGRAYEKSIKTNYLRSIEKTFSAGLKSLNKVKKFEFIIKDFNKNLTLNMTQIIKKYLKENFGHQ